jgi:signal transduction histidine kinase/ActR/RegA family two-component response regulator
MGKDNDKKPSSKAAELRRCAEGRLRDEGGGATGRPLTVEESQRLIHELQVHQIELEMQNEELRETREELERAYLDLYDFAPVSYFTLDRAGAIRSVNLTGAALLGVERSLLINRRLVTFFTDETRPVFHDFLEKVFASDTKETCELVIRKERPFPLFILIDAVALESRRECRVAAIDLSQHRKLEQQLLQANKMESIGLLAGGVAHEFNNLLTAISGYGQIIQEGIPADDELLRESVEQLLSGAERAAELAGSLLAFSRKQLMNRKPVMICSIIEKSGRLIRRVVGADVVFRITAPCKNLLVMADTGQIEQVLMNLVNNARDAMPGGGNLTISTRDVVVKKGSEALHDLSAPGRYAVISVEDTGTGIDGPSMERIFEPFYTTKKVGRGTGLGLSIVHGIIKQHDGSIQVSSVPGKGTVFDIYLPLIEQQEVREEVKRSASVAGGTETLLIAEDEEIVKLFMKKALEKSGYRVIVAGDGEEAVARFRERDDISLVLSDVVMPGMNGRDLIAAIREIKPGARVIFISGYTADIIQQKAILEEGIVFMTKPFSKNDLLRKVREVLDRD